MGKLLPMVHPDEPVRIVALVVRAHDFRDLAHSVLPRIFEVSEARLLELLPSVTATTVAALAMFSAATWRAGQALFFHPDYWRVMGAVAAIVCAAAAIGSPTIASTVPRSLPVLQLLATTVLGRARSSRFAGWRRGQAEAQPALLSFQRHPQPAGARHECRRRGFAAYIQAAAELAPRRLEARGPGRPLCAAAPGRLSGELSSFRHFQRISSTFWTR